MIQIDGLVQRVVALCHAIDDAQIIESDDDKDVVAYGYIAMTEEDFKAIDDAYIELMGMVEKISKGE